MTLFETPQKALALYRQMLRIRLTEEAIAAHYGEQEMRCPVHLCIGQEAVAVGVSAHLEGSDAVFSSHRAHGHYLAKGGRLQPMLDEIYGRESGCARGRGGSMHLIDLDVGFRGSTPIVGGTLPLATGHAFAAKLRGEETVTVCYLGDGCSEEGVFHESLNFASLHRVPVVYVLENNDCSVYTPLEARQPDRPLTALGAAHAVPATEDDGNDLATVHARAGEAVGRARSGGGPSLLVFHTFRWREHCGPEYDDHLGYRCQQALPVWQGSCPVALFRRELSDRGLLDEPSHQRMATEIEAEVEEAIRQARAAPFPTEPCRPEDAYA